MTTLDEQVAAYASARARIDALTRGLDDASLDRTVPCCPAWSVKDLVGHVLGVMEDRQHANFPTPGMGMEGWTAAQVERHRGEPIGEVLDRWGAMAIVPEIEAPSMSALSFDVVTHEHDLCHALGVTGDHGTDSVRVGAARAAERMASMLDAHGAPGVRVSTEDGEQLLGSGADPIALTTSRYALMRLVTGRVSRSQAASLAWDGDATPVLDALYADGFFTLQPVDVLDTELP